VVFSSRTALGDKFHALDFGYSIDFLFEPASSFVQNIYNHPWLFVFIIIIIIIAFGNLLQLSILSQLFAMFTVRSDCDSLQLLLANICSDIFYWDGAGSIPILLAILHYCGTRY